MSWQPIETAPKDGGRILVAGVDFYPDHDGESGHGRHVVVCEVSWFSSWYGDKSKPGWMVANCDEEYGFYIDATHWQPLPTPPE